MHLGQVPNQPNTLSLTYMLYNIVIFVFCTLEFDCIAPDKSLDFVSLLCAHTKEQEH